MDWPTLLCQERPRPTPTQRQIEEKRTEIVRDYGRAVFSTPVRRLQDKAQVFPLEPIDAVRTRLTHSLEVSSIARDLAHAVAERLLNQNIINFQQAYEIETIAATVGLIHDIGNPPFGHAGEQAMQDWFSGHSEVFESFPSEQRERLESDLRNFEGNAQTIRLLAKLQILSDRSGLNLTYATLSAACKYTANSLQIGKPKGHHDRSKLGYFASEDDLIANIRERTGTSEARNPITFLVEASDDIVYSTVDIEDGVKKGVISWGERMVDQEGRRIASDRSVQAGQIRAILDSNVAEIGELTLADTADNAEKRIDECELKLTGRSRDEAVVQYFRTRVIGKAVAAVVDVFFDKYEAIMAGEYHGELLDDAKPVAGLYRVLKEELGRKHVYPAKGNLRLELLGRNVIHQLMDLFFTADPTAKTRKFPGKAFHLLSQNYRTVFDKPIGSEAQLPLEYRRLQLITDYLCGMTDSFATNLHRELFHG